MIAEIMVIAAYLLIVGAALGIYSIVKITSAESMVLSILLVVGVMYAGVSMQQMRLAVAVYALLAGAGVIIYIIRCSKEEKCRFFSPAFVAETLIFGVSSLLFHRAFIQNIDDFHQWAAAVKYMLERGYLPREDFLGSNRMPMYTSVYHLFFQIVGGYHEGNMYTSAMLLNASALMLPIAGFRWKDWKRTVWYVLATFIGIYHLYNHPYKSMYVDLPAAAWTAGIALWFVWIVLADEDRKKRVVTNVVFLIPTALFTLKIKWGIALLLLGFTGIYMIGALLLQGSQNRKQENGLKKIKWFIIVVSVILLVFLIAWKILGRQLVPVSLDGIREALTRGSDKASLTASAMKTNFFEKRLHSKSNLRLTWFQVSAMITIVTFLLSGYVEDWKRRLLVMQGFFTPVITITYTVALYVTYVSTFSYEESVNNAAIHRYFACAALYLFFFMVAALSMADRKKTIVPLRLARMVLLLVMIVGLTPHVVTEASSMRSWDITGGRKIKTAKKRQLELEKIIPEDAKVYMLYQTPTLENMDEFTMCSLLYYMEDQISNYLKMPWKFTDEGSLRMLSHNEATIDEFPDMLNDGGYEYVWVYDTDDYLRREMKRVFAMDGKADQGLYRIERNGEGEITGLLFEGDI